jgi:hypothetical protein
MWGLSSFLHLWLVFTTCPFFTIFVLWRFSLHCLACHSETSNIRWNESSAIKNTLWLQSVFFALTYVLGQTGTYVFLLSVPPNHLSKRASIICKFPMDLLCFLVSSLCTEASFSKISCFLSSLPDISIRKHNFFRYW